MRKMYAFADQRGGRDDLSDYSDLSQLCGTRKGNPHMGRKECESGTDSHSPTYELCFVKAEICSARKARNLLALAKTSVEHSYFSALCLPCALSPSRQEGRGQMHERVKTTTSIISKINQPARIFMVIETSPGAGKRLSNRQGPSCILSL